VRVEATDANGCLELVGQHVRDRAVVALTRRDGGGATVFAANKLALKQEAGVFEAQVAFEAISLAPGRSRFIKVPYAIPSNGEPINRGRARGAVPRLGLVVVEAIGAVAVEQARRVAVEFGSFGKAQTDIGACRRTASIRAPRSAKSSFEEEL